jgi:hypothetical protein
MDDMKTWREGETDQEGSIDPHYPNKHLADRDRETRAENKALFDQEAINEDILRRATGGRPRPEAPQQQVSRPSPETEAMGQMLMEAINREVGLRAQLIEAKRLLETEAAP